MRYLVQSTLGALLRVASKTIGCLIATPILAAALLLAGCGANSATWTNTGGQVSNFGTDALVYDSVHNVLYAGCEQQVGQAGETAGRGVWKYDGKSWTHTGGATADFYIASLAYDSTHNAIYAGCYKMSPGEVSSQEVHGVGVWKYDGRTWTVVGHQLRSLHASALAYDQAHDVLYAASDDSYLSSPKGVWQYDGKSWTDTGLSSSVSSIASLAYDGKHNLLYAGTLGGGGVLKYTGSEWMATGWAVSTSWVNSLAYDSAGDVLNAGAGSGTEEVGHFGQGVWKYAGTNWTETNGAVANRSVKALVCGSDGEVYASCYQNGAGDGVWRYNGTTWTNTGDATSGRLIESLAYDSNHNLLYAGCSGHGGGAGADFGVWRFRPEPSK